MVQHRSSTHLGGVEKDKYIFRIKVIKRNFFIVTENSFQRIRKLVNGMFRRQKKLINYLTAMTLEKLFKKGNNTSVNDRILLLSSNKAFRSLVDGLDSKAKIPSIPHRYDICSKCIVYFEEFGIYTYSNISSKQLSANITYSIDDPTANEWSLNKILIDEGNVHDSLLCALSFTQSLIKRLCIIEDIFRIVVAYNPPEPEDVFDGIDCTVSFYKIRPELPDIYDQDIESYSQALFFCDICCDV